MFDPADNFFKRFLKSPHHLWLAGLTLGVGFLSANVVIFGVCVGLYILGWIHLPDTAMYQKWVKRHLDGLAQQADNAKIQAFIARRTSLISQLSRERRSRYQELGNVCQEIIKATQDNNQIEGDDPRLRKLDELMWTFLRLLVMEGSLEGFIETESQEGLPEEVATCKNEVADLEKQIAATPAGGNAATPAGGNVAIKQRLLDSKKEKLAALVKRQTRLEEARDNQTLVASEQERLVEQIKLLRSDAIASRNTDALTDRINATVDHLNETNKLISEMDQFKDLVADDLPVTTARLGFDTTAAEPPPILDDDSVARRNRARGRTSA
jgi:hypothetical protein